MEKKSMQEWRKTQEKIFCEIRDFQGGENSSRGIVGCDGV
jgi:hypothetical protein